MPGIFNFTGNCFPVSKKRSAGIRQGTFFIESQKSCELCREDRSAVFNNIETRQVPGCT